VKKFLRICFSALTLAVAIAFTLYWDKWWQAAFGTPNAWVGSIVATILSAVIVAIIADALWLATVITIDWRDVQTRESLPGSAFLLEVDPAGRTARSFELIVSRRSRGLLAARILKRVIAGNLTLNLGCDQDEVQLIKQSSSGGLQVGPRIELHLRPKKGQGMWSFAETTFVTVAAPTSMEVDFTPSLSVAGKRGRLLKSLIIVDSHIKTITITRRPVA
jgi:hypothetical protein